MNNNAPIWRELNLQVGEKNINIHETADGPNVLFLIKNREDIQSRIISIIKSTSVRYSSDVIKWVVVDSQFDELYSEIKNDSCLSTYSICGFDSSKTIEFCENEIYRRMRLFIESGFSSFSRYVAKFNVHDSMDGSLIFLIPDINQIIESEAIFSKFQSLLQLASAIGFYFLIFSAYDEEIDDNFIRTNFTKVYDLDGKKNSPTLDNVQNDSEESSIAKTRSWKITSSTGKEKNINLVCADLCDSQDEFDIIACSSYKNDYVPTKYSLIGSLLSKKQINLADLAMKPDLDLRSMGCWLSTDTGTSFHRIACVELLSHTLDNCDSNVDIILQKSFSTLNFLLKQAFLSNISIQAIAMNLLGTGDQAIELSYVLATLISHCKDILENNDGVNEITIYEKDAEKVSVIVDAFNNAFSLASSKPKLFISYSSKQIELATKIRDQLEKNDISCWMAPYSIPAGSSYQELIPAALSQVEAVVLILSPDAEESRWVQKEIGTAIGANKIIVPYSIGSYDISKRFRFLLDGEQILFDNSKCYKNEFIALVNRIKELLKINNLSITYDTVKSSKHNWLKLSLIFLIIATIFIIAGTTIQFLGLVDIVSILKNLLF